ncbi:MAG TPA: PQQ-dependent sugar dehydrogenase [Nitriliruptorales bacterium]
MRGTALVAVAAVSIATAGVSRVVTVELADREVAPVVGLDPVSEEVEGASVAEISVALAALHPPSPFLVVATAELAEAAVALAPGPLLVEPTADQVGTLVASRGVQQVVAVGDVVLPALEDVEVRAIDAHDPWSLVDAIDARLVRLAVGHDAFVAATDDAVRGGGVPVLLSPDDPTEPAATAAALRARPEVAVELYARSDEDADPLPRRPTAELVGPGAWLGRLDDPSAQLTVVPTGRPGLVGPAAQLDGRLVALDRDVDEHGAARWLADTAGGLTQIRTVGHVSEAAVRQLAYRLGLVGLPELALEQVVDGDGVRPACQPAQEGGRSPCLSGERSPLVATSLRQPPGDERRFVVQRHGLVRILRADGSLDSQPFLDLTAGTGTAVEQGLFDLAFAPDFASSGRFWSLGTRSSDGALVLRRHTADGDHADPGSPRLVVAQPGPAHNGGGLRVTPDGRLLIGVGEGGAPDGRRGGQDAADVLGSILSVDPDGEGPPEVLARGLRNPFRLDLDHLTGVVYVADVGERRVEEVNVLQLGSPLVNFGWPVFEGGTCFDNAGDRCLTMQQTGPALSYAHADGHCAVIGGVVYRGAEVPELRGHYLFGDFCAGDVRAVRIAADGSVRAARVPGLRELPAPLYSFGLDARGEAYVLGEAGVFRVVRA